jgi:DNA-directed RNA polymerase specialized sigma24 family protein
MLKFRQKNAASDNAVALSTYADNLLKRHQIRDGNVLHQDASLDVEGRWRETLELLGGVDQRSREIYIACRSGYSYAEIAAFLGISRRKVKKCIARGLLTLMEANRG